MECFKWWAGGFWYFKLFTQSGRAVMLNTGGNFSENLEWRKVTQSSVFLDWASWLSCSVLGLWYQYQKCRHEEGCKQILNDLTFLKILYMWLLPFLLLPSRSLSLKKREKTSRTKQISPELINVNMTSYRMISWEPGRGMAGILKCLTCI